MSTPKGPKTQVIDGVKYEFTILSPRDSAPTLLWLMGVTGASAGKVIAGVSGLDKGIDAKLDEKAIGSAIEHAFLSLDSPRTIDHIDKLLSSVMAGGQVMSLDSLQFEGKLLHMLKVVKVSAEVNYSDFFGGLSGVAGLVGKITATIRGRAQSSGSSGDPSSPA